jgi:hypothetical protein
VVGGGGWLASMFWWVALDAGDGGCNLAPVSSGTAGSEAECDRRRQPGGSSAARQKYVGGGTYSVSVPISTEDTLSLVESATNSA